MIALLTAALFSTAHAQEHSTEGALVKIPPVARTADEVVVERAAAQLDMDPDLAVGIKDGLELIFLRRYEDARAHFDAVEQRHPGSGLSSVASVLVWQALMMENFDYRFDKQYWVASKAARKELEAAVKVEGNDAWEQFLLAGVSGIESIHTMRQSKYLTALNLAFETLDHIERTREISPDYADLLLADGMYNYWRTVVTDSAPMLPKFEDHRQEGIEQMQRVESDGVFLGAPATLSLTFTWLEEKKKSEALKSCQKNRRAYPDNVINNLVLGSIHVSNRRYNLALGIFDEILEDSPKNMRARYWRGLSLHKSGRLAQALAEYQTYLKFEYMEDVQRSQAWYRVGQIHEAKKRYGEAVDAYSQATKLYNHKAAKRKIDALKTKKKAGEISW